MYNRVLAVRGAEPHIFLSTSHDSKKNPLSPEDKLRFAKKIFKAADVGLKMGLGYFWEEKTGMFCRSFHGFRSDNNYGAWNYGNPFFGFRACGYP